jgi:hypothetical protein
MNVGPTRKGMYRACQMTTLKGEQAVCNQYFEKPERSL